MLPHLQVLKYKLLTSHSQIVMLNITGFLLDVIGFGLQGIIYD